MAGVDYLVASSMGNDSIALIQYMLESGKSFAVVYNDTGWLVKTGHKGCKKFQCGFLKKE